MNKIVIDKTITTTLLVFFILIQMGRLEYKKIMLKLEFFRKIKKKFGYY